MLVSGRLAPDPCCCPVHDDSVQSCLTLDVIVQNCQTPQYPLAVCNPVRCWAAHGSPCTSLTTDAPLLQDDIAAVGHLMVMLAASAGAVPSLQHVAAHFTEQFASVLGSIEAGHIRDWHTVRAEAGVHLPGSSMLPMAKQITEWHPLNAWLPACGVLINICHALPLAAVRIFCMTLTVPAAAVYLMSSALPAL